MTTIGSMRTAALIGALSIISVAQQQSAPQSQPQQAHTQQTQPQQQQKQSAWSKFKKAAQAAQQLGTNQQQQQQGQVQQQGQMQQGQMQQNQQQLPTQPQMQQGMQQMQQGVQQVQQLAPGPQGQQQMMMGQQGTGSNCGPSCFDAGPFQANVTQMTMSQQGGWHVIRMNMQFHNASNQPLIIAYHEGSMVMVDNNGNTYVPAGGNPGEVQGMGIDRGNQTDSQFVLAPGQTGNALFSVARGRGNDSPVGTGYTYNLTIDELQPQNGAMALPVRQYNLNFPSLSPSGVASGMSSVAASMPSGSGAANSSFVNGGKGAAIGGMPTQTNRGARPMNTQVVNQPVAAQQRTTQQQGTGAMVPASMNSRISTATKPAAAVKPVAQAKPATANAPNSTTTPNKKTTPTATTTSR